VYTKPQLELLALQFSINLEHEVDDNNEGWLGKPKGLFQILWERGFIDLAKRFSYYSLDGKVRWKDERGEILPMYLPYCLRHLLSECSDFKNEISALEDLASKLSTTSSDLRIKFTPKYHCKIAGEGIEYAWGYSKKIIATYLCAERKELTTLGKV
jgi:hypothetical protein